MRNKKENQGECIIYTFSMDWRFLETVLGRYSGSIPGSQEPLLEMLRGPCMVKGIKLGCTHVRKISYSLHCISCLRTTLTKGQTQNSCSQSQCIGFLELKCVFFSYLVFLPVCFLVSIKGYNSLS